MKGDYVFLDNLNPGDKLEAARLGPYKVSHHSKNEVHCENLITGVVKPFHVTRLSLFTGTAEEAFRLAMADTDQHLLERISGYRGDPEKRETMERRCW